MITGAHKTQRMASAWTSLERYTQIATKLLITFYGRLKSSQSSWCTHIQQTTGRSLNKRLTENWYSMSLRVHIRVQQLALEHYWSIWSARCFANFLTALISLRGNRPCLATSRNGCNHGASIDKREVFKSGWSYRRPTFSTQAFKFIAHLWQISQFRPLLHWEVA
jgi:hypothetical protein